jgi:hypothetical protein
MLDLMVDRLLMERDIKKQTTIQVKEGMRKYKSENDDGCVVVWYRQIRGTIEYHSTSFLSSY